MNSVNRNSRPVVYKRTGLTSIILKHKLYVGTKRITSFDRWPSNHFLSVILESGHWRLVMETS